MSETVIFPPATGLTGFASAKADAPAVPFRAERIGLDAVSNHLDAWRSLADRAVENNPFFRPEFLIPAARELAPGEVRFALIWSRDRIIGLAPTLRRKLGFGFGGRPWGVWSHDYGPLGTPLIDRDHVEGVCAAFLGLFPEQTVLPLTHQVLDGVVARTLIRLAGETGIAPAMIGVHHRAVLQSTLTRDDYWKTVLSANRRNKARRFERKLDELGCLKFEQYCEPDDVCGAFERFCQLEASGWKGARGTALSSTPQTYRFSRDIVAGLTAGSKVWIAELSLDGKPIAMAVSFVDGGDAFTWKMAYDEAFAEFSPGFLLLLRVTEQFLEDSVITRADSLAPANHPLVDNLWNTKQRVGTLLLPVNQSKTAFRLAVEDVRSFHRLRAAAAHHMAPFRRRFPGR